MATEVVTTDQQRELRSENLRRLSVTESKPRGLLSEAQALERIRREPEPEPEPEPETTDEPSTSLDDIEALRHDSDTLYEQRVTALQQQFQAADAGYRRFSTQIAQAEQQLGTITDKGELAARRTEIREAKEQLEQLRRSAVAELEQQAQTLVSETTTRAQRAQRAEAAKLLKKRPQYKDPDYQIRAAEHAHKLEIPDDMIASPTTDHRVWVLVADSLDAEEGPKPKGKVVKRAKPQQQRSNVTEIKTLATRNESEMDRAYRKLQEKRAARAAQ